MDGKRIFRLAVMSGLCLLLVLNVKGVKAGLLPIKSLGHGVVCSKNVCMFTFPKKVNVISIYKYQCKAEDIYCRSAIYIDLGGRFLDLPVFKVEDNDTTNFFYKAIIASHYNSKNKKGIRRFVMEFKTKQIPQIIWDFKTATIEVVNSDNNFKRLVIPEPKKRLIKKTTVVKPKQVKVPAPVKAPPPKNIPIPQTKKMQKKSVVLSGTNQKQSIVSYKNGKINIDFKNIKISKKVLKSPPPKKIKVKTILTFEQMGDSEFKSGHYVKALVWYKKALENTKDTQDRLRITDKIIAVTTFIGRKKR